MALSLLVLLRMLWPAAAVVTGVSHTRLTSATLRSAQPFCAAADSGDGLPTAPIRAPRRLRKGEDPHGAGANTARRARVGGGAL